MSDQHDIFVITEKGLDCTKAALDCVQELGHFLGPIIKAPLETVSAIVNDKLLYYQWKCQEKYIKEVTAQCKNRGLTLETLRQVPLNIAIPLIQAASMDEDDYLQKKWSTLLVNALDERCEVEIRRAFIDMLQSMTSLDAKVLFAIHDACKASELEYASKDDIKSTIPTTETITHDNAGFDKAINISLLNLARLNCIRDDAYLGSGNREVLYPFVTPLGEALIAACSPPIEESSKNT